MVSAGWYPDPSDQNRQRYWDGAQWTEHVQAGDQGQPVAASQDQTEIYQSRSVAAGQVQQPQQNYGQPTYGQQAVGQPSGGHQVQTQISHGRPPTYSEGILAPSANLGKPIGPGFGSWISAAFGGFFKRFLQTVVLGAIFLIPGWILLYFVVDSFINDLVLTRNGAGDPTVDGFEVASLLTGLGAVTVVSILAQGAGLMAAHHYMYRSHMGTGRSFIRALLAGILGIPKYILIMLVYAACIWIPAAGLVALGVLTEGNAAVLIVISVASILLLLVALYLACRFAYTPLTAVTKPVGEGFIRASWNVSRGRFWAILGRTLIVAIVAWTISSIFSFISNIAIGSTSPITFDDSGALLIDGVEPNIDTGIALADFLPSTTGLIIWAGFSILGQAILQAMYASNVAAMYIQDQEVNKLTR